MAKEKPDAESWRPDPFHARMLRPPVTQRDSMEFLSRSWSASAVEVYKALSPAPQQLPSLPSSSNDNKAIMLEDIAGEVEEFATVSGNRFSFASSETSQMVMDRIMSYSSSSCYGVPHWLEVLFDAKFFDCCNDHDREKNMYCKDCNMSVCSECNLYPLLDLNHPAHDKTHTVLQIRRKNKLATVVLDDIRQHTDCNSIKEYQHGNNVVIYINPRTGATRSNINNVYPCKYCGRYMVGESEFCSLFCKVSVLGNCLPEVVSSSSAPTQVGSIGNLYLFI